MLASISMISKSKYFKKRRFFQSSFSLTLFTILILLVTAFFIFSNVKVSKRRAELRVQIQALEKEIQDLEKKNQELKTRIFQSEDLEYLEEVARTQLGLQKRGEQQVVVLPPEKEIEEEKEESLWNPRFWWEWLRAETGD